MEKQRDELLTRLGELRRKALGAPWLEDELKKLDTTTQMMDSGAALAHMDMAIGYLELILELRE